MYKDRFIFSPSMDFFSKHEFNKCVRQYNSNHRTIPFTCLAPFMSMAFTQLTDRESLRDIETCLCGLRHKFTHVGICGNISFSILANANGKRDWRIYQDFTYILIAQARALYIMDKAYSDFERLYKFTKSMASSSHEPKPLWLLPDAVIAGLTSNQMIHLKVPKSL